MDYKPLTNDVILELMFIALAMVLFSLLLNKLLGVRASKMKEIRDKAKNLRERVRQAEILGDPALMQQLQIETMGLMKLMLKKQLIPMCVRCLIFLVIFIIISMLYSQYEYWFWIYFLFSFSFSMIVFGIKYLYKRITKKEDKRKGFAKEIMESIYPKQSSTFQSSGFHLEGHPATESQNISNSQELTNGDEEKKEVEKLDAWKDKIQN